MKKKISLKDIAQQVGVSTALVSYVLNNQKEGRIGKEVAQKIRDTAQKLQYRPNAIARSLKTARTFTLGLMVADIANPFFAQLARIVEDEAERHRYTVLFASSDEKPERAQKLLEVFIDRQVDGLILAPAEGGAEQLRPLKKSGIPFVLLDRYFPQTKESFVVINNYDAAYKGMQHLLQEGCRRIGILAFRTTLPHLQERKRGFLAALEAGGVRSAAELVRELPLDSSAEEVQDAIRALLALPEPVDALVFASNKLSTHGLKYLNTLPLTVPDDLALLSFDQSDATELFYASLTHIRQPLEQLGQEAVKVLLQHIEGSKKAVQLQLPAELVIGASTQRLKKR